MRTRLVAALFSLALASSGTSLSNAGPSTDGRWTNLGWMGQQVPVHLNLVRAAADTSQLFFWIGHHGTGAGASDYALMNLNPSGAFAWSDVKKFLLPSQGNIFCAAHGHLDDGSVLLAGGQGDVLEGEGSDEAFVYRPSTRQMLSAPSLFQPRYYPGATVLADNTLLMVGGTKYSYAFIHGGTSNSSATLSDIRSLTMGSTQDWLPTTLENIVADGSPSCEAAAPALEGHSALLDTLGASGGGRGLIVFGGRYKNALGDYVYTNDVYRVGTDYTQHTSDVVFTWCKLTTNADPVDGQRPAARWQHGAALKGSSLVVFGGQASDGSALGDVWTLDFGGGTPTWHRHTPRLVGNPPAPEASPGPRWGHTLTTMQGTWACFLSEEAIVVHGGRDASGVASDDTWALILPETVPQCDEANEEHLWVQLPSSPKPRYGHVAAWVPFGFGYYGNKVLVHGGFGSDGNLIDGRSVYFLESWNGTLRWISVSPSTGPSGRAEHARVLSAHGEHQNIWIHGGRTSGGAPVAELWTYHFSTGQWTQLNPANVPAARADHVFVFDGLIGEGEQTHLVEARTPELFNPGQPTNPPGSISIYPTTVNHRVTFYPMLHSMPDGKILLAGPDTDSRTFNPCVSSPTWGSLIANSTTMMKSASVQYLPGKYMKAGWNGQTPATGATQVLDATSGGTPAWTTPSAAGFSPRAYHQLTLLPTGAVLATGGTLSEDASNVLSPVKAAQIWSPPTAGAPNGTWTSALASDPTTRGYHSNAVLLPDGRVLTTMGGFTTADVDWSIYEPPYLFDTNDALYSSRPVISTVPSSLIGGRAFQITLASTTGITSACLMRPTSSTHQRNFDQTYVPLTMSILNGTMLQLTAPDNPNTSPPGDYLLFVVKTDGGRNYPSVAKWVRLTVAETPIISADDVDPSTIHITWTAPYNSACTSENLHNVEYDLRVSTSNITSANFNTATRLTTYAPGGTGAPELAIFAEAEAFQNYYFALKVKRGTGAWSAMSNVDWARTKYIECEFPPCFGAQALPTRLELTLASEMPSHGPVRLRLALPAFLNGQSMSLRIHDVSGREVANLVRGPVEPGHLDVTWDPRTSGTRAEPGVYFATLRVGATSLTRSLVVLK